MKKYLPSEKLSDDYLAWERDKLRNIVFSLFENPFAEEIKAVEKIEDRYEQLKECVRLQDKMQKYVARDEYPKEIALQFLAVAELAVSDKAAFNRYFEEHSEYTVITFYRFANTFFESLEKSSFQWQKYKAYESKDPSQEFFTEILRIRKEFFEKYPQWAKYVIRIEASKLSFVDKFMRHNPVTDRQKEFKKELESVLWRGIKDFYKFSLDPSLSYNDELCFNAGKPPAIGKTFNWWDANAKSLYPAGNSRLGTKAEYVAFMGILIKRLVEEAGWNVSKAWKAVCDDSSKLGQYRRKGVYLSRYNRSITGFYNVLGFFDLANTYKVLTMADDTNAFWLASGCYDDYSDRHPLYSFQLCTHLESSTLIDSVGWIVMDVEE